jgi:hypothetical protein
MDKWIKNVWCVNNGILLSPTRELVIDIWYHMSKTGGYDAKWSKSNTDRRITWFSFNLEAEKFEIVKDGEKTRVFGGQREKSDI